nr:hypothetical protein [Tanacetum cinerariifolium]
MTIETHNWASSAYQEFHKIEADSSFAKHKILELKIERLLKAVVSQDIISVMQNASVVDTSDLQTELERMKERFENCIIKKETEYAKLWNDWYKKCDECKYDKISYDKAYKNMQQKIERLQAQLGDLKEYAKLWNDWYKKCDECKYDKLSYYKAYKDMQQKIERLQAQLGDLKGKCKDTSCVSDTQNQLSQKLENANVELEFQ